MDDREKTVREMLNKGHTFREIGDVLGVTRQAIHKYCDRRKLKARHSIKGGPIPKAGRDNGQ